MLIKPSTVPYNYKTIRVTQSRLNKGLLSIPQSLIDRFPRGKTKIKILVGTTEQQILRNFTPCTPKSKESRITGLQLFYHEFNVRDGDEIVIQFLDDDRYRILTDRQFQSEVQSLEKRLDGSRDELEAQASIEDICAVTSQDAAQVSLSEFYRLSTRDVEKRKKKIRFSEQRETVDPPARKILAELYQGKCQITGFT